MPSLFGGGQSQAQMPQQPPFHPMDISKIADRALAQDISRYQSMGFPVFPGLSSVRQSEIEDAYKQLTQPLGPEFQREFMNNATASARSVVGGGDPYSAMGMQKGSFSSGVQSAAFAKQDLAKQDYDRSRMESLISQNPVPGLGLSQNDLMSMYVYNTGAQNQWSMGNYANQIAGANAAFQNQARMGSAIGNTIGQLGSVFGNIYNSGGFGFDSSAVPSDYGQSFTG